MGGVAGEFRGTPKAAAAMKQFLRASPPSVSPLTAPPPAAAAEAEAQSTTTTSSSSAYTVDILDYPNTRIQFHFADFKLVSSERRMCFKAPPYACSEQQAAQQTQHSTSTASCGNVAALPTANADAADMAHHTSTGDEV